MLREADLPIRIADGRVYPCWVTARDHRWIERLLDRLPGLQGCTRDEVTARLRERPELGESSKAWRCATSILLEDATFDVDAVVDPVKARRGVFDAAAADPDRNRVLRDVASSLECSVDELERSLYADLPGERIARFPSQVPDVSGFVRRLNMAIAQSLARRAETLHVRVTQHLAAVLRMARLSRLLCWAEADRAGRPGATLSLSGPLSLFHRTTMYGRAMARWLPFLARTRGWSLRATCVLGEQRVRWLADHREPIEVDGQLLKRFDSRVEQRLFEDLSKAAPHLEILREAGVHRAGNRLVAPDFLLRDPVRRKTAAVEVVGFWTPSYIEDKLKTLARLPRSVRWILCVDETLGIEGNRLPDWPVLRYRKRIDAAALLRTWTGC